MNDAQEENKMKNYYSTLNILTEIMLAKCRDIVLVEIKAMLILQRVSFFY